MSLQLEDLFSVKDKVVVITGGGTGLGLMIATTLENNGALVYILGRRLEVLQKAAKENAKHGRIIPLQCDVTSRENLLAAVETIEKEQGYVNVLFANSGVMYNNFQAPDPKDNIKAFQSKLWNAGTPEEFTKTFDVNCTAVYYTAVAFLELLHEGNKRAASLADPTSQIIITSSIAAYRRDTGVFSISYGASKAAATLMGKTLANTFKGWKIRVNTIAPGIYPSEMTRDLVSTIKVPPEQVPLERLGQTEDMGGLAVFLCSKAGAYVSGGIHVSDGGRLGLFASTY